MSQADFLRTFRFLSDFTLELHMVTSLGPGGGNPLYTLSYDADHARATQTSGDGTVQYFNDPAGDIVSEGYTPAGGSAMWQNYLVARRGGIAGLCRGVKDGLNFPTDAPPTQSAR